MQMELSVAKDELLIAICARHSIKRDEIKIPERRRKRLRRIESAHQT